MSKRKRPRKKKPNIKGTSKKPRTFIEAFDGDMEALDKFVLEMKPGTGFRISNAGRVVPWNLR